MTSSHVPMQVLDAVTTLTMPLHGLRLIEASAGTGKTYAISNLYLRHVLEGVPVSAILVVTFTNAATEELRGRIRQRLQQTLQWLERVEQDAETPPEDAFLLALLAVRATASDEERRLQCERLQLAVRTMDEAAIYTIHGFCLRALTDHAFNSGQPFDMQLITDEDGLWQDALKDWWRRNTYALNPLHLGILARAFDGLDALLTQQRVLRDAHDKRVLPVLAGTLAQQFARWDSLLPALQRLSAQWQARQSELEDILLRSPALSRARTGDYGPDVLPASLALLDAWLRSHDLLDVPARLHLLSAAALRAGSTPAKRDKDPALMDPFFVECQAVEESVQDILLGVRLAVLQDCTRAARAQIDAVKTATRSLGFSDQLTRLHEALHGAGGEALAQVLRRSFPVAMIDEFQDTDALQYGIFRRLYHGAPLQSEHAALSLTMIGDPKQAIYSFRGGDIFAYAMARRDAGASLYTLDTNWRSTPALIAAVNTVLQQRGAPFVFAEAIAFAPVAPAPKQHAPLYESGHATPPLQLWQIPADEQGRARSKRDAEAMLSAAVAQEIVRLLAASARGEVSLGEKRVEPGNIAVLVRDSRQGRTVREALMRRGINAVTAGRDNVLRSEEAAGLLLLLRGIVHCRDRGTLRAALASSLLGFDYTQIAQRQADEQAWLEWAQQLSVLNEDWQRRGFMVMFHAMLQSLGVGLRLAATPYAERRLTNLLHLGELLQQSARSSPGQEALLSWFEQQIAAPEEQETELRLESDEALVKIVTIHASKGLEYPIVFAPFLWGARPVSRHAGRACIQYHDLQEQAVLDFGVPSESALALADRERLAEDVRLAYVALTRACSRLYLAWGNVGYADAGSSALSWLLLSQRTPADLLLAPLKEALDDAGIAAALQALVAARPEAFALQALPVPDGSRYGESAAGVPLDLQAHAFHARIATDWRISSFSSLTRDVHQSAATSRSRVSQDAILQFEAGSHVGLFLHEILEHLDFQGDLRAQTLELNARFAPRYGFDARAQQETLVSWIRHIVLTPLTASGLRLATLPRSRRLNELAFDFAIDKVDLAALNALLDEYAGEPLQALQGEDLRGLITGVIDLVFEHEGRFYIADYKSNLLGNALQDYAPSLLRRAMLERRYDLQSLLYVLALHRYLQQRLPDYAYERHMGGALYLFLRGLRVEQGPASGVVHDCPPVSLIARLEWLLRPGMAAGEGDA